MSELRLKLTKTQINFLCKMLEIESGGDAVMKFADIMIEEKMSPKEMSKVLDVIMGAWRNRK